jgi:hypothetical protein
MWSSSEATKSDLSVEDDEEWVESVFRRTSLVAGKGGKPRVVVLGAFPQRAIRTDKIQLSGQIVPMFSEDRERASLLLQIMARVQQDEFVRRICEWGLIELREILELAMRIEPNTYTEVSHILTASVLPFRILLFYQ